MNSGTSCTFCATKLAAGGEQGREESCEVQGLPLIATGSVGQQQGCGWEQRGKGPLLIRQWFGLQPGGCRCQYYWGLGIGEVLVQQSPPANMHPISVGLQTLAQLWPRSSD